MDLLSHSVCLIKVRTCFVGIDTIVRTCNCHLYKRNIPCLFKNYNFTSTHLAKQTWEMVWSHRGIGQLRQHIHSSRTNQIEG